MVMCSGVLHRKGPFLDPVGERFALYHFHSEKVTAAVVIECVNRGDIGMVEEGEDLRFAFEPRQAFRVLREGVGKNLKGDVAPEFGIAGAIHFAHTTRTELRRDLVVRYGPSDHGTSLALLDRAVNRNGIRACGRRGAPPRTLLDSTILTIVI